MYSAILIVMDVIILALTITMFKITFPSKRKKGSIILTLRYLELLDKIYTLSENQKEIKKPKR